MVVVQYVIGVAKIKSNQQHSRHKFHGVAGKLTYDLAMLAIVTGCLEFLPWTPYNLGVVFSFWLLWLSIQVRCQARSQQQANRNGGQPDVAKPGAKTTGPEPRRATVACCRILRTAFALPRHNIDPASPFPRRRSPLAARSSSTG